MKLWSRSSNKSGGNAADEMSFIEHLEELRWHILRALAVVVLIGVGIFLAKEFIFETVLFGPKRDDFITYRLICSVSERLCFYPPEFQLLTRDLGEQFITHLKVSFWLGLVVGFPYVLWEVWRFIRPGLYEPERKATRGFVSTCSLLFYMGVLFGYFIIAPFAVTFLAGYDVGATSAPTLTSYVNYMTMFTVPTGLVFELPVIAYILSKIGLPTPALMKQ